MASEGRRGDLSGLEELLRAVAEQPEGAADDFEEDFEESGDLESASGLLALMLEREWLELASPDLPTPLVKVVAELLAQPAAPDRQAEALMDLLIEQESVEEVYASEEDLETLLSQW